MPNRLLFAAARHLFVLIHASNAGIAATITRRWPRETIFQLEVF
jgi:hypothetical protein